MYLFLIVCFDIQNKSLPLSEGSIFHQKKNLVENNSISASYQTLSVRYHARIKNKEVDDRPIIRLENCREMRRDKGLNW